MVCVVSVLLGACGGDDTPEPAAPDPGPAPTDAPGGDVEEPSDTADLEIEDAVDDEDSKSPADEGPTVYDIPGWEPDPGPPPDTGGPDVPDVPDLVDVPAPPDIAGDAGPQPDIGTGGPLGHPYSCDNPPPTPVPFHTLTGFSGSEDFAFDKVGNLVSANGGGNLTKQPKTGAAVVFVPNSGIDAGTAYLPDGRLVGAGNGKLIIVAPNGGKQTLLSGLEYPNGLDVDTDGTIFVAEQNGSRLRAVDPDTGAFEVVSEGLTNANGVSFGPNYESVFVGSFGAGKVWRLDRSPDGTWGEAIQIAKLPPPAKPVVPPPTACDDLAPGTPCMNTEGQKGLCTGAMGCVPTGEAPDMFVFACLGLEAGAACTVPAYGTTYAGECVSLGSKSYCDATGDVTSPCVGKAPTDGCVYLPLGYPTVGGCASAPGGMACGPAKEQPSGDPAWGDGGLDGLNVDECGYAWVTEYIAGIIWRVAPDGTVDLAAKLPSSWIPNMHWGSGVGGWEKTVLYVMDRDQGRVFGLEIGLFGKEQTVPTGGDSP